MEFYQAEGNHLIRKVVTWIVDIVVMLALALFFLYAFGGRVVIAGQSMTPLLKPDDVILMNRLVYDFSDPKRLDVVVFAREDSKWNVKRVIGLPGDTIQIRNGYIYIDGERLEADGLETVSLAGLAEEPVVLGADEYFLLGDNRDSSEDSRFSNVGNVKRSRIIGKVWLRAFPLMDIALIPSQP